MKYALKSKVSLAVFSLVMGMNVAHAAQSTDVKVTGRVAATTCDVLPVGVSGGSFDLGSVLASDFVSATTKTGKNQISIKLNNCAAGVTTGGKLGVYVNGAVLSGANDAFNDDDGGNLAIKVSNSAYTTDYKNGDFIADTSTDETSTAALVPIYLSIAAPKFSSGSTVSPEDVTATLRFTADYK